MIRRSWLVGLWLATAWLVACARAPQADVQLAPPAVWSSAQARPVVAAEPRQLRGGESTFLADRRQLTHVGRNGDARFASDGQRLVYQSLRPPAEVERLMVIGADGHSERFLPSTRFPATGACFAGSTIYYSARPPGEVERPWVLFGHAGGVTQEVALGGPARPLDVRDASYSSRGEELFFSARAATAPDTDRDLYVWHTARHRLTRLTETSAAEGSPAPTPDGKKVAFWRDTDASSSEIWLLDRQSAETWPLTGLGVRSWAPAMHPSGRFVVFGSAVYGEPNHELLVVEVDTGALHRVTDSPGYDGLPAFSPDGTTLAWTSSRQGGVPQLFIATWREPRRPAK